ncbi:hypothetical protein [Aquimarina spongiae]|nr:hypothetical protein [Aquimarina spongiae]
MTTNKNLFFFTTESKIDFDLLELLNVFESVFETNDFVFELLDYEYNDVNFTYENINQSIVSFLKEGIRNAKLIVSYKDFLKFAQFIGHTESGTFHAFSFLQNINLKVSVYDSYFWSISSNDKKVLVDLSKHEQISCFNGKIE